MQYLLDTCVFAEYSNPKPVHGVRDWLAGQPKRSLFISVVSIGEIQKGIARLALSKRRTGLEGLLEEILMRYKEQILDLDRYTLLLWGKLNAELEIKGRPLPVLDSLIAATALQRDITLVTRNTVDFTFTGVKLFNPWRSTN